MPGPTPNPEQARRLAAALDGALVHVLTQDGVDTAPLHIPRSLLRGEDEEQ